MAPSDGMILNAQQSQQIDAGRFSRTGAFPLGVAAAPAEMGPVYVDNHIEIGGEVVRVVRTEISDSNRKLKRDVRQGVTR